MPELGHKIGPFELVDCLSSDQYTSLFKALRVGSERTPSAAAIRIANSLEDSQATRLVELEYKILKALEHTSIPKALSHYAGQGAITMSWIDGVSIHEIIHAHQEGLVQLDHLSVWEIICEAANVLKYAHSIQIGERSLIHGRLSPRKIILMKNGGIKLLGLGKPPGLNLPYYSPPEQAVQAFIDWRSDQWALASISIEMLLKEKVYSGRQSPQQAAEQGEVQHWVKRVNYEWPEIGLVLKRMLAPAAGDRYQNHSDWLRDMIAAKHSLSGFSARKSIAETVFNSRSENTNHKRDYLNTPNTQSELNARNGSPAPIAPKKQSNTHHSFVVELDTLDLEADLHTGKSTPLTATDDSEIRTSRIGSFQSSMVYCIIALYFTLAAYALLTRLF